MDFKDILKFSDNDKNEIFNRLRVNDSLYYIDHIFNNYDKKPFINDKFISNTKVTIVEKTNEGYFKLSNGEILKRESPLLNHYFPDLEYSKNLIKDRIVYFLYKEYCNKTKNKFILKTYEDVKNDIYNLIYPYIQLLIPSSLFSYYKANKYFKETYNKELPPPTFRNLINYSIISMAEIIELDFIIIKSDINEKNIKLLNELNLTLATMESCTGGLLISKLTDVPGASNVINGGYITYTNDQKIKCGVSEKIINEKGVYSAECSESMAFSSAKNSNSNIGIGITGTFSNLDKNNVDSKRGIVYYTIVLNDKVLLSKMLELDEELLNNNRLKQKEYVVSIILNDLYEKLK